MGRLEGKITIVTGAGSGIGKAIAKRFAAEGARVVCADISGKEEEIAESIGAAAQAMRVDVSSSADVERMIASTVAEHGRLDVLCNNAGWGGVATRLVDTTDEYFDRMIAINLRGVFLGMRHAIPVMERGGGGAIVNTSSAAGVVGWPGISIYSAAKAGVIQMTKSVAIECADNGVRVNAVCPGLTWTPGATGGATTEAPPPGAVPPGVPMGRWGMPSELAGAVLYLASDDATYVTGHALVVDGGYTTG
jgi:NAD(P)-dependent dehydrogenase (short-subunit alcohol dehydrogenase family)